ncbi:YraN family protein [Yaniella halotolerans]|uniref:YraN family protein n=1 Tax=Yaniella halotolerans TaxID=225453 RepID=UPI0003B6E961|nr:YraN family protein [Yaniella halotolerans]
MTFNPSQPTAQAVGIYGEDIAVDALAAAGYQILERNWSADAGEVDVIAYHRHHLVAIEIKTRAGRDFGDPIATVTPRQLRRVQRGLLHYKRSVYPKYAHTPIRVDVVGVLVDRDGETTAELLQDVS